MQDPDLNTKRQLGRAGRGCGGRRAGQRGYVLMTFAVSAVALFGALGMAVDIGRMFIAKTESQAFSDSAALAAALQLNGASSGITAAHNAVANNSNRWNFDSAALTNYTLTFGTSASGPWVSNPSPATGYSYARVQATAPVNLFFIPVVVSVQTQNVISVSVAGQVGSTGLPQGLGPFSAVGPTPSDPNFGLVVGQEYDLQWPAYNGSRAGCTALTPDQCFVKPPCSGDLASVTSMALVTQQWGASVNGYWGSNANSTIDQEVLNVVQLQAVPVGGDIPMSSGNKSAEATALDTRVNEDGDITDNYPDYLSSSTRNGRRLIGVPVVTPTTVGGSAEGQVLGYGSFLLLSNGNPSNYYAAGNGNDPFCAVYVGGYTQGGTGPAAGGAGGYFKVKLVQ